MDGHNVLPFFQLLPNSLLDSFYVLNSIMYFHLNTRVCLASRGLARMLNDLNAMFRTVYDGMIGRVDLTYFLLKRIFF